MNWVSQAKLENNQINLGDRVIPLSDVRLYCIFPDFRIVLVSLALIVGLPYLVIHTVFSGTTDHSLQQAVAVGLCSLPSAFLIGLFSLRITLWTDTEHLQYWTSIFVADHFDSLKSSSIPNSQLHDLPPAIHLDAPNERFVLIVREAPVFVVRFFIHALLVAPFLGVSALLSHAFPGEVIFTVTTIVCLGILGILVVRAVVAWFRWFFTLLVLTTHRLVVRSGVVSIHQTDYVLSSLKQIDLSQTLLERLLDYATLFAHTYEGPRRLATVHEPSKFRARTLQFMYPAS